MARSSLFAPAIADRDFGVQDDPGLPGDPLAAFTPLAGDPGADPATSGGDDAGAGTHTQTAALKLDLGLDLWRDDALSASRDALTIDMLRFTHDADDSVAGSLRLGALDDADARVTDPFLAPQIAFASPDGSSVLATPPVEAAPGGDVVIDLGLVDAGLDVRSEAGFKAVGTGGGGSGVVTNYYSGSSRGTGFNPGPTDPGYDIWIEFKGTGWTAPLQQAFKNAADYLTTVITGDIGGGGSYRGKVIDDLYVTASLATIDGTGGILGQAGPSAIWSAKQLTAAGQMQFDVADATNYSGKGLWDDIVTHEMMHVLGFGTLWEYGNHNLVDNNFGYTGAKGVAAYQAATGTAASVIPVENDGGPGTAGGHWDEQALKNELMTGYINDDGNAATTGDNYLSKFSVMSLADLGYIVAFKDYPYDALAIA